MKREKHKELKVSITLDNNFFFSSGHNTNPTNILNEMGDLLRTTPEPYAFNTSHWRYNGYRAGPYGIATETIAANRLFYQFLQDFCHIDVLSTFVRYNPRKRRIAQEIKPCLVRDKGAVYDRYCINSLNVLRELIKENIVTLNDDEITFNSVAEPDGSPHSDCHPALSAVGGAVTGAASALAVCLAFGGAYIPVVGWVGCSAASAIYGVGGTVVGTSLSLAHCK